MYPAATSYVLVMFFPITHENKRIPTRTPSVPTKISPRRTLAFGGSWGHFCWVSAHCGMTVSRRCLYLLPPNWGSAQQVDGLGSLLMPSDEDLPRPTPGEPGTGPGHGPQERGWVGRGAPGEASAVRGPPGPLDPFGESTPALGICCLHANRTPTPGLAWPAPERAVAGRSAGLGGARPAPATSCGQAVSPEP